MTHALAHPPVGCRGCGAPLAPDQRYCLTCGGRVAPPRVAHLALLAAEPEGAAGGRARPSRSFAALLDRIGGPMGAAAVVVVALGVGFLLGRGAESAGPATVIQRPPIVNVQSGPAAAETAAPAATSTDATRPKRGSGAPEAADVTGVPKAAPDAAGGDLGKLQQQPDATATEGPPPSEDDKTSGGGSAVETIG